ncbi:MAG: penicillin-binding transpeptidase domain-containing protein [Christensenella sp.]
MATSHVVTTRKRLFWLLVIFMVFIVLLMARVGYWSLWKGDWLKAQAETQWVKDTEVGAKRGSIMDRNMQILAQSAAADTVVLLPEKIAKEENAEAVADNLSQILGLDREVVYAKATNTDKKEIWLKRQISTEESNAIEALGLKGVAFRDDVKRFYPNKDFASQVIGYTNLDGEGQTGIERRYNTTLAGRDGRQVAETAKDGSGVPNERQMQIEPQDGQNVVLTVDEITQSFLETSCKELFDAQTPDSVQGIVMDVTNGEVLAMANIPEFDLNAPPREDAAALAALSVNTLSTTAYEPGNIFGLFTTSAAIDSGKAENEYNCTGTYPIEGETIFCNTAHGMQNIGETLTGHCSVGGAMQAAQMQKDDFYKYLKAFGFGQKTGIDFSTDTPGDVTQKRYARETDIAMMGAGTDIKVSQIQLASAAASIINGGTLYTPKMVIGLSDAQGKMVQTYEPQPKGQSVSNETAIQVKGMLEGIAQSDKGIQIAGYSTGSTYGTAQYEKDGVIVQDKEIATYIAYAPADHPKYMVMITATGITSTKNGGTICAPYVQQALTGTLKNGNVMPSEDMQAQEKAVVPSVVGMDLQTARDTLANAGFKVIYDGSGIVQSQIPAAGEEIYKNANVSLAMETKTAQPTAADKIVVPNFAGMDITTARDTAISSGLVFIARGDGTAQNQSPAAGSQVEKGSSAVIDFKLPIAPAQ